jgi:hypothetical protein
MSRVSPELLARCYEDVRAGSASIADCVAAHPEAGEELAELLALAAAVATTPVGEPRPGFVQRGRAELLAAITQPGAGPRQSPGWREAVAGLFALFAGPRLSRAAVSLSLAVSLLLALGGGAVYAAQGALPGDSLYAVKTTAEGLRLQLSSSDLDRTRLHLDLADTRLGELQRLAAQNRFAAVNALLPVYQSELALAEQYGEAVAFAGEPPRQAELALLRARLRQQEQTLAQLQGGAPADVARGLALAAARARGLPAVAEERWHVGSSAEVASPAAATAIATLDQLELAVTALSDESLLPGESQQALLAKLAAARDAAGRGQAQAAASDLEAFRYELEAQYRAGHLSEGEYQYLLGLQQQALATLPPAKATGETKPTGPEEAATPAQPGKPTAPEKQATPAHPGKPAAEPEEKSPAATKVPPGQDKKQDRDEDKGRQP